METTEQVQQRRVRRRTSRRSFLVKGAAVGVGTVGAGWLLTDASPASASGGLTKGDAAILRFLAAAELIETDLWQQYNELAGIQDSETPGGNGNPAYTEAVAVLDTDMAQYIHDDLDDEISHGAFINAYLNAHGKQTVNLDKFRTLPSSKATGAQQIGRLTNLMQLTVDTTFWTRYRSDSLNPDFGDKLPQAIPDLATRRSRAATPTSPRTATSRRSPTRPASTSPGSSRAVPASTPRSPSGSPIPRCCASCSASAAPRSCTSRPGRTRPATRLPLPTPPPGSRSLTSMPTANSRRPT